MTASVKAKPFEVKYYLRRPQWCPLFAKYLYTFIFDNGFSRSTACKGKPRPFVNNGVVVAGQVSDVSVHFKGKHLEVVRVIGAYEAVPRGLKPYPVEKPPLLWALKTVKHGLMPHTVSSTKTEAWDDHGWSYMCHLHGDAWEKQYWKRREASIKDFERQGGQFVRVKVVEVK
jgi:hypothetical protein